MCMPWFIYTIVIDNSSVNFGISFCIIDTQNKFVKSWLKKGAPFMYQNKFHMFSKYSNQDNA